MYGQPWGLFSRRAPRDRRLETRGLPAFIKPAFIPRKLLLWKHHFLLLPDRPLKRRLHSCPRTNALRMLLNEHLNESHASA